MSQQIKEQQLNYDDVQKALALHIWKNGHLRDEIIKNPKETIERELNFKFTENIKIDVVNQVDPNEVTFILPYSIHKAMGEELTDDQLEVVAGGINKKVEEAFKFAGLSMLAVTVPMVGIPMLGGAVANKITHKK